MSGIGNTCNNYLNSYDLEMFLVGRIYEKLTRTLRVISNSYTSNPPLSISIRTPRGRSIDTEKVRELFKEAFHWHTIADKWQLSDIVVRHFEVDDVLHALIELTKVKGEPNEK